MSTHHTSRYSNHSAPSLQSRPRSFVRKLATFCRPLLDMKPVSASSLMLASTKGTPVRPSVSAKVTNKPRLTWIYSSVRLWSTTCHELQPFHASNSFVSIFHGTDFPWSPKFKLQHCILVLQTIFTTLITDRTFSNITFDLKHFVSVLNAHKLKVVPPQELKNDPARQTNFKQSWPDCFMGASF